MKLITGIQNKKSAIIPRTSDAIARPDAGLLTEYTVDVADSIVWLLLGSCSAGMRAEHIAVGIWLRIRIFPCVFPCP